MKKNRYVIFGTGALGIQFAKTLDSSENEIIMVNRSGIWPDSSIKAVVKKVDSMNGKEVSEVLKDCTVAINCIGLPYPEWDQLVPITKNIIHACKENNTLLAYVDNIYAYGEVEGELFENTPCNPKSRKGKIRKEIADILLEEATKQKLKMVIGRSSDFYGPYEEKSSVTGVQVIGNVLKNKKAMYIGRTDMLRSISYIEDVVKAMKILIDDSSSHNQIWHLPNNSPLTLDDTIDIMSKILNKEINSSKLPYGLLTFLSLFNRDMREMKELFYLNSKPLIVNDQKFKNKYQDFKVTDYYKGIDSTISWYQHK
ncbi:hypothetical protein A5881_003116 [Enterococcus termitis]